ncbi:hypothetical protein MO973_19530 [Paenibacillus sp. TRM 82003]|nr:hypothetical protein [Paenibacillus sp. TRM 82003]
MEWLQSDWFMWVVMIVVLGSICSVFFNAFENAGFDGGEFWGFTKKAIKYTVGFILLPVIIWFKK